MILQALVLSRQQKRKWQTYMKLIRFNIHKFDMEPSLHFKHKIEDITDFLGNIGLLENVTFEQGS